MPFVIHGLKLSFLLNLAFFIGKYWLYNVSKVDKNASYASLGQFLSSTCVQSFSFKSALKFRIELSLNVRVMTIFSKYSALSFVLLEIR